jgi:hypothetical protein
MITIGLAKIQYILALLFGIGALIVPKHLHIIVGVYLIVVGLIGLGIVR